MRSVLHVVRRNMRSKTVLCIDGSSCLACSGRCCGKTSAGERFALFALWEREAVCYSCSSCGRCHPTMTFDLANCPFCGKRMEASAAKCPSCGLPVSFAKDATGGDSLEGAMRHVVNNSDS